jgi:tetratricopeptide (TPR) repeat protein
LTAELFYRLMVADVAAQRGEGALAAREFLAIARETRDPGIARRATEVALAARVHPTAVEAATLWLQLEPGSERAQRILAALKATTGSLAEVREPLQRLVADAANGGANTADALMQLGRLLASQKDRVGVYKLVIDLAAPYAQMPEAHFAVAQAALGTGLGDDEITRRAYAEVDRALELRPGWDRAVLLRAQLLSRRSPQEATDWLRKFADEHPEARSVRTAFAQSLLEQRKYADARAVFQKLLDEDPSALDMQYAVALVSMQMRDYAAAEKNLQALKAAGFGEPGQVQSLLAQVSEEQKRYEEAIDRYREVDEGDRWWGAQMKIATLLGKLGRVDEARKFLDDLPDSDPQQQIQVRQAEAQVLREAGRNVEAFDLLDEGLKANPDNQDLMYDLAMVAEKLDRLEVAEKNLRRLIELAPDSAHALNALGYTLVDRTDRVREGLALIERAIKLAPNDPFILDSLGWAHFRLGNLDESEKALRRALAERQDPEIAAHLGEVLWTRGQRDEARQVWQMQLKDTPENPLILETIRRLQR